MKRPIIKSLPRVAAVVALVAAGTLSATAAHAETGGGNVSWNWSVAGAPSTGLTDLTFPMTFSPETERRDGIYVAQQFGFHGVSDVGYTGLQPRHDKGGTGQMLGIFSSFVPGSTTTDPLCHSGADGYAGVTCNKAMVNVVYGHTYALKVEKVSGTTWQGTAIDTVSGARTHLGSYTLPAGTGNLKTWQAGFLETYWGSPDCASLEKTVVRLGTPTTSTHLSGSIGSPHEYSGCIGKANLATTRSANGDLTISRGSVSAPAQSGASVSLSGSTLSATLDTTEFLGANRYVVLVNGKYAMESYGGQPRYGSARTSGDKTVLSKSVNVPAGSTVELMLAPNYPGESLAGSIRLASSASADVTSVSASGSTVTVGLKAAAQAAPNRYVVKVNGHYLMESYAGTVYYGSKQTSGDVVNISKSSSAVVPGAEIEVYLAPGYPGSSMTGAKLLATAIVPR